MKKIIAISLVAILAVGSVFAAYSGSATVGVGANFDSGEYGFIGNDTNVEFNVDLATASAEAIAEGDVYASVKASLSLFVLTGDGGVAPGDPIFSNVTSNQNVGTALKATIDEAKIAGANWYVSLLGVPGVNDFAKSAIDTWTVTGTAPNDYGVKDADSTKNATYKVGYTKAPGVEVGVYDYVIGAGFKAKAVKDPFKAADQYALSLYAKTPEYNFDGVVAQVGASYSTAKAGVGFIGNDKALDESAFGASVKAGYVTDTISATVSSDLGYDIKGEKFGVDVAANVAYDFITVDGYYANDVKVGDAPVKNLLSTKVVADLNSFDVPVKLTATLKDLVNKQDMGLKAEFSISNISLTPSVGYVVKTKTFTTGIEAKYAAEDFTAKGAFSVKTVDFKGTPILGASASVESTTLVPGATVKLAWSGAKDLLDAAKESEDVYGKVIASVNVAF